MGFSQKITDAMNNYSRSVTRQQMDEAPTELKYVYIGPVDEKTRPFCLEAAGAGPLTLDEINSLGGEWVESLSSGGGINCRHNWELASSDIKSQFHNGEEALKAIKQNKEKAKKAAQKTFKPKKKINPIAREAAGGHKVVKESTDWIKENVADSVKLQGLKDVDLANQITYAINEVKTDWNLAKFNTVRQTRSKHMWAAANGFELDIATSSLDKAIWKERYDKFGKKGAYLKDKKNELIKWENQLENAIKRYPERKAFIEESYGKIITKQKKQIKYLEDMGVTRHNVLIKGQEMYSTVVHEMGHMVSDHYFGLANPRYTGKELIGYKVNKFTAESLRKEWNDIFKITTKKKGARVVLSNGKTVKATGEAGVISHYALKNVDELFAESFNMYYTDERKDLPKIISDFIKDLSKYKGKVNPEHIDPLSF